MSISVRIAEWLFADLMDYVVMVRDPDERIGDDNPDGVYLNRWWLCFWRHWFKNIPVNELKTWHLWVNQFCKLFLPNLYLHEFVRSDDDRALHDHPAWSVSLMLSGPVIEHTIAAGGIHQRRVITTGTIVFRSAKFAHRIELPQVQLPKLRHTTWTNPAEPAPKFRRAWSLFLIGPKIFGHKWGFHCPERGFIPWEKFGSKGCDA